MAEKKMTVSEETAKEIIPYSDEWYEELVPYELFKDDGKYKDDVNVTHNGIKIKIPRGEQVMIKRKYALILDQSKEQDRSTANMIRNLIASAERAKSAL